MNEAFIWLSGLRFIDKQFLLMARNCFQIFTENIPVREIWTKYNIPDVNWLIMLCVIISVISIIINSL